MKNNSLKTLIITSWSVLILCLIIKLFGGNWFELASNNKNFIQICNYVDNKISIKIILACIFQLLSGYLVISISMNKTKFKCYEIITFGTLLIARSILGWYVSWCTIIFDILVLLALPMIMTKKVLRPIICFLLLNVYQIISLLIRNFGFNNFNDNSTLLSLIMQVDYYVMLLITWLYNIQQNKRKENK